MIVFSQYKNPIKSVKNITVKKIPSGKYFASLCFEPGNH